MAGWVQESFQLAKSDVYLEGKLKYGTDKENAALLPEDYVAKQYVAMSYLLVPVVLLSPAIT